MGEVAEINQEFRREVEHLEQMMLANGGQLRVAGVNDINPLVHRFVPGMYCREIFMPAGMRWTTMIHRYEHFAFILTGKARVISEQGGDEIIEAPCIIVTTPGTKRVLHVLEDMRWATVHLTEGNGKVETKQESDLGTIEEDVVVATYEEYDRLMQLEHKGDPLCLGD